MKGNRLLEAVNVHRTVMQRETDSLEDAITVCGFLLFAFICDLLSEKPGTTPEELLKNLTESLPQLAKDFGFQVEHIIVPDSSIIKPLPYHDKAGRVRIAAHRATRRRAGVALYVKPFVQRPKNLRWLMMDHKSWHRLMREAAAGTVQIIGVFRIDQICPTEEAITAAMTEALEGLDV